MAAMGSCAFLTAGESGNQPEFYLLASCLSTIVSVCRFFRLFVQTVNRKQNIAMRAPFSSLAKQVLSSPESAAELRRFLSGREKTSKIIIMDEGKRKVIKAEKLDDIATTTNL